MRKLIAVLGLLALTSVLPQASRASLDGTPSTGSFTVGSGFANLATAIASGNITVTSTSGIAGAQVGIGGLRMFIPAYLVGATTNSVAVSLMNQINAANAVQTGQTPLVTATVPNASNVVHITANSYGTLYNGVNLYSSSPSYISTSGSTLASGKDNAQLCVDYICEVQGKDWFVNDSAAGTALSIATAINRDPRLNAVITAVPLGAVVFLQSRLWSPTPFPLSSSDSTDLTPFASAMYGGTAGNVASFKCPSIGQWVSALPTSNYPAGCIVYLTSYPTVIYLSTETVVGVQSWLAK